MRIAQFTESFEPLQNGVSTSVRTLVDEMRSHRHHVIVVAPHYPDYVDESPFVLRVPSMVLPFTPNYPVSYPIFPRLRREFSRTAPDVLHSHNPFFLGLLAARLARQHGVPLISTYHTLYNHYGHYVFFIPQPAALKLLEWWIPEYYNRCDEVIAPSRIAENSLREYGVETPITVIPTAVPLPSPESVDEPARMAVRRRFGIPGGARLLLFVGRLAQEKNVELVIAAFTANAATMPDLRLLVVGGGPHEEALRKHAAGLPAGDRIVFAGPMARTELDPVYAAADLFVFGSSTETQGLVVAEARAAGTPCVVVNEGGAGETVRDGEDGLTVPSDSDAFATAVELLLTRAERRNEMASACLSNAHRHTPRAMAESVMGVYRRAKESALSEKVTANSRE